MNLNWPKFSDDCPKLRCDVLFGHGGFLHVSHRRGNIAGARRYGLPDCEVKTKQDRAMKRKLGNSGNREVHIDDTRNWIFSHRDGAILDGQ